MDKTEIKNDGLNLETGWLCLDFANTVDWHLSEQPQELLNNYSDLAYWAQKVGLLTEQAVQRLLQEAANGSNDATMVLKQAIDLRETIYRIFAAIDGGQSPDGSDLALLNIKLQETLPHLQIVASGKNFTWVWRGDKDALDQMLWPVAQSAAELLTSESLARVKVCEDDRGCGYIFMDLSKNRSRRWCDMKGCGNRAKVRRHRERQQSHVKN